VELSDLDHPVGFDEAEPFSIGVASSVPEDAPDPSDRLGQGALQSLESATAAAMLLLGKDGVYYSRFVQTPNGFVLPDESIAQLTQAWPNWNRASDAVGRLLGGGVPHPDNVAQQLLWLIGGFAKLPTVATIVTGRHVRRVQVGEASGGDWFSGKGIVSELAALQDPPHNEWEKRQKWHAINRFIQTVLGDDEASINIPYDHSIVQVETKERVLPLASLGSGVEQVVILAAASTVHSKTLVCIEEPETNLHPLLQKKLIRYLTDQTDNQYVIATHSSHFLDDGRATAHSVRLTTAGTQVERARRTDELVQICNDLGYRPSDLMQANCVIWVEGPSDRIYLRNWLRLFEQSSSFEEGVEYSIMFYGGSLLSHLTVSEDALDDFVKLRRLNRASAILIDSDLKRSDGELQKRKQRIVSEFSATKPAPGRAWVTDCYTIENYLPEDILRKAVATAHPKREPSGVGQWDNPLEDSNFDKIAIARAAEDLLTEADLDQYDLKQQLAELVDFIRTANGLSVKPIPV